MVVIHNTTTSNKGWGNGRLLPAGVPAARHELQTVLESALLPNDEIYTNASNSLVGVLNQIITIRLTNVPRVTGVAEVTSKEKALEAVFILVSKELPAAGTHVVALIMTTTAVIVVAIMAVVRVLIVGNKWVEAVAVVVLV